MPTPPPRDVKSLAVLRHGKSDWSAPVPDMDRPLTGRGIRQARRAGAWIGENLDAELALVSVARRAQQTWDVASTELARQPVRKDRERLYTFDGREVLSVVRAVSEDVEGAVVVGHNPALEEVVELLTGEWVELKTSAIALVRLDSWTDAGDRRGDLIAHGRPPG